MKYIHLSSIDSTNAYLKKNYEKFDNYTFVSTDEQLSGRGRNNREWKSENGKNLLFSLFISDNKLLKQYKAISVISALSIIQVLERYNIDNLSIKWPNDVYVGDSKICGILLEGVSDSKLKCLIIGVGLNVNQVKFIGEYATKPISIKQLLNKDIDIEIIKKDIYENLISNLEKLKENYSFYQEIVKYDYLKGKEAFASLDNKEIKVLITGINDDYSLSIINNSESQNIESGEISFHKKIIK